MSMGLSFVADAFLSSTPASPIVRERSDRFELQTSLFETDHKTVPIMSDVEIMSMTGIWIPVGENRSPALRIHRQEWGLTPWTP